MPSKILSKDGRFVAATQYKNTSAATTSDNLEVFILDKRKEPYEVVMAIIKNTVYGYVGKKIGFLVQKNSLITPELISKAFGLTLEQIFKRLTTITGGVKGISHNGKIK